MNVISRTAAALAGGLLLVSMSGTALAGPPPNPPSSGCPAGFEVLDVQTLKDLGYVAGPAADANNDNKVCGKPFSEAATEQLCPQCTNTYYNFRDNDLGPQDEE